MDRIEKLTQEGKDEINKVASGAQVDEDGNELEFIDKIILKTNQVKDELETKIEEQIVKFYKKMNIAHLDEIKALNQKVEESDKAIALLEARLNHLDAKK